MDLVRNGWFTERCDLWPGQTTSLEVEKILYVGKSEYQNIMVLKTKYHGNALVLDGLIQCTERDEFSYQEMIAFLPLNCHPNPSRVLIVGGGDGGVAREVNKHPKVISSVQVEIDAKVVEVSRQYLPNMAKGFSSPKLTLKIEDGFKYMEEHTGEFDVIITDSSDPIGPATNLFTESYFKLLKQALKPGGVICSQNGTMWDSLDHIKATMEAAKKHFPNTRYTWTSVPTYPTGVIGFLVASLDPKLNLEKPSTVFSEKELETMDLKYYSSDIHKASFILPNFVRNTLYK